VYNRGVPFTVEANSSDYSIKLSVVFFLVLVSKMVRCYNRLPISLGANISMIVCISSVFHWASGIIIFQINVS